MNTEQSWQFPQQDSHTLSHVLPSTSAGSGDAASNLASQQTLPMHEQQLPAETFFGTLDNLTTSNGHSASEQASFLPLTREGLPYDAFEDEIIAFFRGEVPSYLDTFNFDT